MRILQAWRTKRAVESPISNSNDQGPERPTGLESSGAREAAARGDKIRQGETVSKQVVMEGDTILIIHDLLGSMK